MATLHESIYPVYSVALLYIYENVTRDPLLRLFCSLSDSEIWGFPNTLNFATAPELDLFHNFNLATNENGWHTGVQILSSDLCCLVEKHDVFICGIAVLIWYCRYYERQLTDATIQVGSCCFNVHRAVLSCYSKYFACRLLPNDCSLPRSVITLGCNIKPKIFNVILEFMYTGG